MDKPDVKQVVTGDGSASLYSKKYRQYYHNPNGAVSESRHVFLNPRPVSDIVQKKQALSVFETGFGTGLNLLLLLDKCLSLNHKLHYTGVEAELISPEQFLSSGYDKFITHTELMEKLADFLANCTKDWNKCQLLNSISVSIYYGYFKDCNPHKNSYDIIFHDAFSPDVNPELWSLETFKDLYKISGPRALLTTYCAASKARAAMAAAGWYVARAPGALGKREMTLSAKQEQDLVNYKRVNEQRLIQRWSKGDFNK